MKKAEGGRRTSDARLAAFHILRRVEEEGAYSSILLARTTDELNAPDRALCYELVLGVLRRQIWLDRLIEHYAERPADDLDPAIRRTLRLGLYQLRFLTRIPASAAVNESVNLARRVRQRRAAGLVNAVLRRAARELEYDPAAEIEDPIERLAVQTSHPQWLISKWIAQIGEQETEAFAQANNEPAPISFRLTLKGREEDVWQRLQDDGRLEASKIVPGAWRAIQVPSAALRELIAAGKIYLQDEASQLVAHVLGAQAGERVFDACAAPGGKTTHIASLTRDLALIIAGDVHAHRLRTVRDLAHRQGISRVHPVVLDAEKSLPFGDESFDRVLVDAPCSGTGTLRRNPEIRYRLVPGDFAELRARQRRILAHASRVVRRKGRLVYSTCSVEFEENEEVVNEFLRAHPEFTVVAEAVPARFRTPLGGARTWPHREGSDGFFMIVFERDGNP